MGPGWPIFFALQQRLQSACRLVALHRPRALSISSTNSIRSIGPCSFSEQRHSPWFGGVPHGCLTSWFTLQVCQDVDRTCQVDVYKLSTSRHPSHRNLSGAIISPSRLPVYAAIAQRHSFQGGSPPSAAGHKFCVCFSARQHYYYLIRSTTLPKFYWLTTATLPSKGTSGSTT
jgi:hypothetical protein